MSASTLNGGVTPWYPRNVKPVRPGVYERKMPEREGKYSYWSKGMWGGWGGTIAIAYSNREYKSGYQRLRWRGLNHPSNGSATTKEK